MVPAGTTDRLPMQAENGADGNLLTALARAAADPQTDVEKMRQLLDMYREIKGDNARQQFAADLAQMLPDLPSIGERGNAAGRYTYALWEDINEKVKPILSRYGFALTFRTQTDEKTITVTGVLTHKGGHREETTITLPSDPSGNKNAVQAVASSVSYGKRYTAGALLNLTSHGEDDDAFRAAGPSPEDDPKFADWRTLVAEAKTVDELGTTWAKMPADARKALSRVKDARKRELSK